MQGLFSFKVLILSGLLVGCSSWSEQFDCPIGEGMRCSSMSAVHKKMDKGEIRVEEDDDETTDDIYFGSEILKTLREEN